MKTDFFGAMMSDELIAVMLRRLASLVLATDRGPVSINWTIVAFNQLKGTRYKRLLFSSSNRKILVYLASE